jgi:branched-chain amino acid transport system substrate-binding protein
VAGCGGEGDAADGEPTGSRTLTVYSSLPLEGLNRRHSQDVVDGMKLALREAGGRAGPFTVNYVSLDDADPETGEWDPDQVLANARVAVQDRNAIAYLGDFDSGATALALPLLNEAGIPQISPTSTYAGLTRSVAGRRGEPERFYPSGVRTFARPVPTDETQAAAQAAWMAEEGVRRLHVLHDGGLYGRALAALVEDEARERGIRVVAHERVRRSEDGHRDLGERVAASGADAAFFGGSTESGAARLFADLHAADPGLELFGGDGLAESAFTERLPQGVARRVRLTSPALPAQVVGPAAERFAASFRREFGRDPEPYATHGHAAMQAVIAAMRRAGSRGNDRAAVRDALLGLRLPDAVIGPWAILPTGESTQRAVGAYRVRAGELVLERILRRGR